MHHKLLATLFVATLFTVASASAEITFEHVAAYVATAANDDPQLSADGKLIAVQRNRDGNETVDIIKLDGGGRFRILSIQATNRCRLASMDRLREFNAAVLARRSPLGCPLSRPPRAI